MEAVWIRRPAGRVSFCLLKYLRNDATGSKMDSCTLRVSGWAGNTKALWNKFVSILTPKPASTARVARATTPLPAASSLWLKLLQNKKNLWRTKCVRRAIFRSLLQPLLCLQHVQLCHCATSQGSSYSKNEYSLFYQKFDAENFFIGQFFRKKLYFQRNLKKLFWGRIWQFFGERRSVSRKLT